MIGNIATRSSAMGMEPTCRIVVVRRLTRPLLNEYSVRVVLHGHFACFSRTAVIDEPNVAGCQ